MSKKLILVFILAFILRIGLVGIAHHGDLNNNISWGNLAFERGLVNYYEGEDWPYSAPNQPPLYILLFTAVRAVSWFFDVNMEWLVKIPGILADLGIGYLIYKITKRWWLAAVWLFNPVSWYNSSVWGQTDAIVNLLGLAAVLALLDKRLLSFSVLMTLSFLFKGSLLIFVPVLLFVAIRQKHTLSTWLKAGISSLLAVVTTSLWFHPQTNFFVWLFNLYQERILPGEIGYLTANAFNFWWLVDPGKTLDSTVYFGLPARVWGFVVVGIGLVGIIYWLSRKKVESKRLFLSLAIASLLTFLFLTRIHERYLYPFFPYATILLTIAPAMVLPYIILSLTHLLNLYHLFWAPSIPVLESLYTYSWFPMTLSIINLGIFVYLLRQLKTSKV